MKSLFQDNEVLVLDGAMGTQLIDRGLGKGQSSFIWNAEHADTILDIHRSYASVGANCLTTNTFSGSPIMLDRCGIGHRFVVLNRLAVELARDAGGKGCKVLGDIGPCGDFIEPYGELPEADLESSVQTQADVLADAGVDGFIVETMADPNEMRIAVSALKDFGLPIIASFTYEPTALGMKTMMGGSPTEASRIAIEAGASAIGANCGTSLNLEDYLKLAQELLAVANGLPVLLQPNAGTPVKTEDGGFHYAVQPDAFGAWASAAVAAGVKIVGGCCGTTPAHIAAVATAVRNK
ncbi:MAG: homocysteine S-methyltransferase family protein [Fimbriimonas sp.]|nr:homocysteine S-methyltransferase family protein [Fimbriimonas sp.]